MKKISAGILISILLVFFISFTPPVKVRSGLYSEIDSLAAERAKFIHEILDSLKGKEMEMDDILFKNIRTFKGQEHVPLRHFLGIMDYWGEALGVSCTKCHNTSNWASDELPAKQIAREMYGLRATINASFANMKDIDSGKVLVNCGTCHNGSVTPRRD